MTKDETIRLLRDTLEENRKLLEELVDNKFPGDVLLYSDFIDLSVQMDTNKLVLSETTK